MSFPEVRELSIETAEKGQFPAATTTLKNGVALWK